MKNALILTALLAIVAISSVPVLGESLEPLTVSPGAADRYSGVEVRCPTFSWQAVPGALGYEVVVYELPSQTDLVAWSLDEAVEVLFIELPAGVTAWTPSLESGLARGADHVWFVRGVFGDFGLDEVDATDWSVARFFRVAGGAVESETEVRSRGGSVTSGTETETETGTGGTRVAAGRRAMAKRMGEENTKDVGTAMAAIRGEMPDVTGETYGVVGTSNSPDGAGLGAVNTAGGPDLVLDGAEDGEVDTLISQNGIRRSSPGVESFMFENIGGGDMYVGVIGTIHGNGSGLVDVDAETLNGHDSSAFSPLAHLHDDRYYTEGELNTSGGGGSVHWDNLGAVPADVADGDDDTTYTAGPGLILSGTEFRTSVADSALIPSDHSLSILDDAGTLETHLAMTIGSDGLALVAYFDNSPAKLKVAHCDDPRCASASVATISGSGEVDMVGGLVVGSDGLGLMVYQDVTDDLAIEIGHCDDIPCSSVSALVLDPLPGNVWCMPSMALGSDGYGLVAYFDGDPGDENLNVAHCENVPCTSATVTVLDTAGTVGWLTSVAIGSDGLGLISYYDNSTNVLKVAHCDNVPCTTATIATLGSGGRYPSVTIGSDGMGLISYVDISSDHLNVAHCENQACTVVSTSILDNSGNVIRRSSATVGADGLGLIAYADFTLDKLKVAHCQDLTCSQATVVAVADNPVDVEAVIGVDGLPLMSFYQETAPFEGTVNVLRCSNEFCVPYFRRR